MTRRNAVLRCPGCYIELRPPYGRYDFRSDRVLCWMCGPTLTGQRIVAGRWRDRIQGLITRA